MLWVRNCVFAENNRKGKKKGKDTDKNQPKIELYNLANDLGEKNDLAGAMPEKVQEFRAKLDAAMKAAVPSGEKGGGSGKEED